MAFLKSLPRGLLGNPWFLLALAVLFWSGNVVAARLAVGELSPMLTVTLRWTIVGCIFALTSRRQLAVDLPVLRQYWKMLVWMGALAFTIFNALYYTAAHFTSGVHIAIIQGVTPVFVFLGARLAFGTAIGPVRTIGLLASLAGIVVVATDGNVFALRDLTFNSGDLFVLIATILYSIYIVALPNRPKVSMVSFFAALSFVALLTSLPLLAAEMIAGQVLWPSPKGWLIVTYIAVFPSLVAQLFFIRAVELVGPGRAGLFYNLTPVVGAILAVVLLHEPLGLYQLVALILVVGGIFIAELGPRHCEAKPKQSS